MKIPVLIFFLASGLLAQAATNQITTNTIAEAEHLYGLQFTPAKRTLMLDGMRKQETDYETMRKTALPNSVLPSILFNPIPVGMKLETVNHKCQWSPPPHLNRPEKIEDAAFYSIGELSALIKARKITSEELTRMYLERLKKFGPKLECVVTLTEDLALEQARQADKEIAAGKYRGPLHGIPYGVKDLLATKGIRTTWGSSVFKDRVFDEDATVVKRLTAAGAVLVAKLSMGELAWGDVWFGGKTRNPWNIKNGSSGSSAGPASATSAGLVAFAIGSETHGSIISPSSTCGVTGLRPTYGRVSRAGAMSLSWTMDKLGPICRTVEDCAMVLDVIRGPDGIDPQVYDAPFNYQPTVKWSKLRIGYLRSELEKGKNRTNDLITLGKLETLGAKLVPMELPKAPWSISMILDVEGATAFDDLTRSGKDDLLVRQMQAAWPNVFRKARLIPAVEYLQAQRIRTQTIQEMAAAMKNIDVYIAPTDASDNLYLNNLTGHPAVVLPNGFTAAGLPTSICFVGKLFGEADLLAVAKAYQDATAFHLKHPSL